MTPSSSNHSLDTATVSMPHFVNQFPSYFFPTEWLDSESISHYSVHGDDPFPQDSFVLSEESNLWPLWKALGPEQRKTEWRKRRERCMIWFGANEKAKRKELFQKEQRAVQSVEQNRANLEKKLMTKQERQQRKAAKQKANGIADNTKKRKRNEKAQSTQSSKKKKRKTTKMPEHAPEAEQDASSDNDSVNSFELNRFRENRTESFGNRRSKLSLQQKLDMVKQQQKDVEGKEELAIRAAVMKAEGKRDKLNPKVLKGKIKKMKRKKKKTQEQWESRVKEEKMDMKNRRHIKDLNRQLKRVRGRPGFEGGRHILNSVSNIKQILKNNQKKNKGRK